MESALSSAYMEILMQHIQNYITPVNPFKTKLYIRYVDSVLIEWTYNEQELVRFEEKLKQLFNNLTIRKENNKIRYLGIRISKNNNNVINTKVCRKPTNVVYPSIILRDSYCPIQCKLAIFL